jgi:hypothetical protein
MEGTLPDRNHWERIVVKVKAFKRCNTRKEEKY